MYARNEKKNQALLGKNGDPISLFNIDLTNRFHVAVRLLSNRSQKTSKCGKNKKKVAHEESPSVSLMFLPHFEVFCGLFRSLNRRTATWNLFVLYNNEKPFLFQNI